MHGVGAGRAEPVKASSRESGSQGRHERELTERAMKGTVAPAPKSSSAPRTALGEADSSVAIQSMCVSGFMAGCNLHQLRAMVNATVVTSSILSNEVQRSRMLGSTQTTSGQKLS